ncbi:MAG: hypothetical protein NW201_00730 [Gemmatimonadales bacterium]|nr:hypothetical protein [Gemmatimonadales bacterium]
MIRPALQPPDQPDSAAAPPTVAAPARRPWSPPQLESLPSLTDLTLQTGGGIGGGGIIGGGGSTVF